jgi:hypothetical protein
LARGGAIRLVSVRLAPPREPRPHRTPDSRYRPPRARAAAKRGSALVPVSSAAVQIRGESGVTGGGPIVRGRRSQPAAEFVREQQSAKPTGSGHGARDDDCSPSRWFRTQRHAGSSFAANALEHIGRVATFSGLSRRSPIKRLRGQRPCRR